MIVTNHFVSRVRERIGPDADPYQIATGILTAIEQERTDLVESLGRLEEGKHLYRFRYKDGRGFFAVVQTDCKALVTLMPTDFFIRRKGKFVRVIRGDAA